MRGSRFVAVCAALAIALGMSAQSATAQGEVHRSRTAAPLSGSITVLAAASLTEAFTAIAHDFTRLHPRVHVTFSFGASNALAAQIVSGAPADVFASASVPTMQQIVRAGAASKPSVFARNRMIIVTPPDNPAHIRSLRDLARSDVSVAVCAPQVPCGTTANAVFARAGLHVTPVTAEVDVKSVLTKVELGEVDAGIVYVTDANSAGASVASVTIPARWNSETAYPIVALRSSPDASAARAFVAFVRSAAGERRLAAVGFARG